MFHRYDGWSLKFIPSLHKIFQIIDFNFIDKLYIQNFWCE